MATHSSILAWESHGQRSLVGYHPCYGVAEELEITATKQEKKNRNLLLLTNLLLFKGDFLVLVPKTQNMNCVKSRKACMSSAMNL